MSPASKATAAKKKVDPSRLSTANKAAAKKIASASKNAAPAAKKAAMTKNSSPVSKTAAPAGKGLPATKKAATSKAVPAKARPTKVASTRASKVAPSKATTTGSTKTPSNKSAPRSKKTAPPTKKGPATAKKAAPAAKAAGSAEVPAPRPVKTLGVKPKLLAPVRPKTGPYAKEGKFLEEQTELLVIERDIYQEQATSLRAEADSLALSVSPATCSSTRSRARGAPSPLTVSAISPSRARPRWRLKRSTRHGACGGQDLRLLRALLPAHPQASPAGPSLRPPVRGLQERGVVAALKRGGTARLRIVAYALAVIVLVADRVTTSTAEAHLHGVVHLWGPFGLALSFNSGFAFSLFSGRAVIITVLLSVAVVVLAVVVARARTVPQAVGGGLASEERSAT